MKITIPNPCSENWEAMEPREKSRFCASCQKCVIDFTASSDKEIYDFLKSKKENVCGRFTKNQIDRTLVLNKSNYRNRRGIAASLLFLSTLGYSKSTTMPIQSTFKIQNKKNTNSNIITENNIQIDSSIVKIMGIVLTNESNIKEPLPYASIKIKGTEIVTSTNFDGEFELLIPNELTDLNTKTIVIDFAGFISKEITLSSFKSNQKMEIFLEVGALSGELIVVEKRTFFQKIKYFLKRLF
jgi:hypothetical protein